MRINDIDYKQISKEKSLRVDYAYQELATRRKNERKPYYSFSSLFATGAKKYKFENLSGDFSYCQISDVGKDGSKNPIVLNFDNRNLIDESYYKKIEKGDIMEVYPDDILMSFLLPQDPSIAGKFTRVEPEDSIFYTTAFLRLHAYNHPKILYYALKSIFYPDMVATARIRKGYTGYATLSEDDLKDLQFDARIIDKLFENHEELESFIDESEKQIRSLRETKIPTSTIIDSIFQESLGYNYDTFEELRKNKRYESSLVSFGNNPDLRFSAKFHRPAGDFVFNELTRKPNRKIKYYLAEPICLGASISPADFDEEGSAYYVSMATIKSLKIDLDDTQLVKDKYFDSKKGSKSLKTGDIVIARSGVAIGKTAIVEEDFDGIFADFTMRVRFDQAKYNPYFAYYYFRSKYFQYLIEIYKKGLQNQNIFPIVIQEFPLPDISMQEQSDIVERIKAGIKEQNTIQKKIEDLQDDIVKKIKATITL